MQTLIGKNYEVLKELANHCPTVGQPDGTIELTYEVIGKKCRLDTSKLRGVASLDRRLVREDGSVLFMYAPFHLNRNDVETTAGRERLIKELVFVLYQIRNNIVHGGSASFFMMEAPLAAGTLQILEDLVEYLFERPNILLKSNFRGEHNDTDSKQNK